MHPMRMGRKCMTGITFHAATINGKTQNRVVMAIIIGRGFECRISLINQLMKQMCAMAKPPICPSKLPHTPIASPMAQKQKASVISQGSNLMPPNVRMTAGKASRMTNSRLSPSGFPTGTKNHTAASRKATTITKVSFFSISIAESFARGQSADDSASR